jgi:hypothetical protein
VSEEPGQELEPFKVTTGPLEVSRPLAHLDGDGAAMTPDFVMVGVPQLGGGVMLFASRTLTQAALRREVRGFDIVPITARENGPVARVPRERRTITAEMTSFQVIYGDSYPEALRSLLEMWSR